VQVAMPAVAHSGKTVDRTSPHLNASALVSFAVDNTRIFDQSASSSDASALGGFTLICCKW
jgi:hypothetical protein